MPGQEPQPRIPPADTVQLPVSTELTGVADMAMLFRVMGHRPVLMQQAAQLLESTMRSGTVDAQLKELVAIRVSQVNACFY